MKKLGRIGIAVLGATSLGAAIVQAQSTLPTYRSLLSQGFELKTVTLIPTDMSTRLYQSNYPDTVLVTLQKGPVTATCAFTLGAWNAQNQDVGSQLCKTLTE
jgi:hypothetical protein